MKYGFQKNLVEAKNKINDFTLKLVKVVFYLFVISLLGAFISFIIVELLFVLDIRMLRAQHDLYAGNLLLEDIPEFVISLLPLAFIGALFNLGVLGIPFFAFFHLPSFLALSGYILLGFGIFSKKKILNYLIFSLSASMFYFAGWELMGI